MEAINKNAAECEPEWLQNQRRESFQKYQDIPLEKPERHIGRALNLSGLDLNLIVDNLTAKSDVKSRVNISYDNSDRNQMEVMGLREGLARFNSLRDIMQIDETLFSNRKFAFLNSALWNTGLFIHLKSGTGTNKTDFNEPFRINMKLMDSSIGHMFLFAEPDSSLFLLVNQSSQLPESAGKCYYHGCNIYIYAGENSRIKLCIIQNHSPKMYHFRFQTAHLQKNSSVEMVEINTGGNVAVSEFSALLQGESSSISIFSIFSGSSVQQFDLRSAAVHIEKNTVSNMLTRGILNDSSQAIYRGLIRMGEKGRGSIGNQRADSLLLSTSANADARPVLEIMNNDVKCSHGVSIGKIDNEKLFYMMSRGISKEDATRTFIQGFLEPILIRIPEKEREYMSGILSDKLKVIQHGN